MPMVGTGSSTVISAATLRGKAEVSDDGDFRFGEGAHQLDTRAFDLDRFGARFLDKANGVGHALGNRAVIAAKRHVSYDKGAADGAADGAGVVKHFIDSDGEGVFVAQNDHS